MAKTDTEYAELVDTLDIPIETTSDRAALRRYLLEQLGKDFTDEGLDKLWGGVETRFTGYREVGVSLEWYKRGAGKVWQWTQPIYRDIKTGRFMPRFDAASRIEVWRKGL